MSSFTAGKQPRSALRAHINAKRGETNALAEGLDDITLSGQINKSRKSGPSLLPPCLAFLIKSCCSPGKLDIASLKLARVPAEVYTKFLGIPPDSLSHPPSPPRPSANLPRLSGLHIGEEASREQVFGKSSEQREEEWVEPEELISFKAGENSIQVLDVEIGAFGGLKTIDLHANRLSGLPDSFADLMRLTSIDFSRNALASIPPALLLLPALQVLDLSHNLITSLDLSSPIPPSDEGMSYGAGFLSTSFSRASKAPKTIWPSLKSLNLGFNKITSGGLDGLKGIAFPALKVVNFEGNLLEGVLDIAQLGLGGLSSLILSRNLTLRGVEGNQDGRITVEMVGCGVSSVSQTMSASAQPPKTKKEYPDVDLGATPNPSMTITYRTTPAATFDSEPLAIEFDIYLPPVPVPVSSKGHPVLVWWHGGGLLQGNKENLPPHLRRLPAHSYEGQHVVVISPNYRLAPQAPILDILSDSTALVEYVKTKLNDRLKKEGKADHLVDVDRIGVSGGSAGGYLALLAGLPTPPRITDEQVGGYRGEKGIKCIAPFYPITDLTHEFWATETDPVPWMNRSVPHSEAKPHLDAKSPPVATAVSGGPRSVLYPYMLQHSLFPSLLFLAQRSVGRGSDAFRPTPESLSIPQRLALRGVEELPRPPVYFVYGTADTAVNPFDKTLEALKRTKGELKVEVREGEGHAFDEDEREECAEFREWLGRFLVR
ncbi:hypothetical protein P7C73_g1000, partial [Tremellales sp. Uapishka_1]